MVEIPEDHYTARFVELTLQSRVVEAITFEKLAPYSIERANERRLGPQAESETNPLPKDGFTQASKRLRQPSYPLASTRRPLAG